jgi:ABC-type bacteriocin/lantibiotic exporter with double-glycine peptidase domain
MEMKAGRVLAAVGGCLLLGGCSYLGTARDFDPREFGSTPGWVAVPSVPLLPQKEDQDCGAAALSMVLTHWGPAVSREEILAAVASAPDGGLRAGDLRDFARARGFKAYLFHGDVDVLQRELSKGRPVLVGLVKPYITGGLTHYAVVVGIHPAAGTIVTLDPADGWRQNTREGFAVEWESAKRLTLVIFKGGSP